MIFLAFYAPAGVLSALVYFDALSLALSLRILRININKSLAAINQSVYICAGSRNISPQPPPTTISLCCRRRFLLYAYAHFSLIY